MTPEIKDLVERLRNVGTEPTVDGLFGIEEYECHEAATLITNLSNALDELERAAQEYMSQVGQGYVVHKLPFGPSQDIADRKLRQALSNISKVRDE